MKTPSTMTSAEYRRQIDRKAKPKVKPQRIDKAAMFANIWRLYAPKTIRLTPEFRFAAPRRYRADFRLRGKVLVEVDGGQFAPGGGRHARDSDREKGNLAAALGYRVFHFSPQQLERDPIGCVNLVLKAVNYKGTRA